MQISTFLKACTDQLLTSSPCKILPHPLMPCLDIWDLFQAGNNGYKKRLMIGTTRDRESIHESRGVKSIPVSCRTYYESILLQLVSDPE